MSKKIFLTLFMIVLAFASLCGGSLPKDGFAYISILDVNGGFVFYSTTVSGRDSELHAFDLNSKKVLWKKKFKKSNFLVVVNQSNIFILNRSLNLLSSYQIKTGHLVWSKSIKEIKTHTSNQFEYFSYPKLLLNGASVIVLRAERSGYSCLPPIYANDWLSFDSVNGNNNNFGNGVWLGSAGDKCLFSCLAPVNSENEVVKPEKLDLYYLKNNKVIFLSSKLSAKYPGWHLGHPNYYDTDIQHLDDMRCLVKFKHNKNTIISIFDSVTDSFYFIKPQDNNSVNSLNCFMSGSNIIHYTLYNNGEQLWLKYYNLNGLLLKKVNVSDPYKQLYFKGTTSNGDFLITDYSKQYRIHDKLDFQKKSSYNEFAQSHSFFYSIGSNLKYYTTGDVLIKKGEMASDSLSHELVLGCMDVQTGQSIFRHVESVIIKKMP